MTQPDTTQKLPLRARLRATRAAHERQVQALRRAHEQRMRRLWAAHQAWLAEQAARYPAERVLAAVAAAHGLALADLRSATRARPVAHARHHAVWELRRRRQDLGLLQLAALLNRLDHTTARNGYERFCALVRQGHYAAERAAVATALDGAP